MKRLPPTQPWPDTGRTYPEGAELRVIHIHEKWADLMWLDPTRQAEVYISTIPWEQAKALGIA